ncbi:SDR family NAD(P)-dependent oxidoreductase [Streptomyces sp. DSM 40750]|uniref:SDR family NAD(P)-dependent oxidoreductase n=1 Tax=Streptomyces sp. DSM 40750 TaxID=2801030 RepID=UPI00214C1058|nr:SDR family oxidoreductase [Streptomyces sp. DSM 40750]UUU26939.1 SDR family oxidoreductase [Streptomyces sp. DSM 40750]
MQDTTDVGRRDLAVGDRRKRFLGKTCLVTGGSRGLGLAAARAFAREGARVVIIARDPGRLKTASELIGDGTIAVAADLSSPAAIKTALTEIAAQVDRIDAAFINAGHSGFKSLDDMDEATWDMVFDINVKGSFFVMQGLRPLLAPGGAVVFCGSVAGRRARAGGAAYGASKAALEHLTRILADEVIGDGIRVNIVIPGGMNTDIAARTTGLPPGGGDAMRERIRLGTPMLRLGEPEELADAVLFLASSEAGYITGAALPVDGGATGFIRSSA